MKLHDFGLWFVFKAGSGVNWSSSIPSNPGFTIWYDGKGLGEQDYDFLLSIYPHQPYRINLTEHYWKTNYCEEICWPTRILTFRDFEILPNPEYRGDL